jgi:2-amino-4-hydroxy-6-hydroxymethyldihydropteridine diphosphokinase
MRKIYIALGSNVGDKKHNIQNAISRLTEKISEINVAPFYTSKAVGYTEQDNFMNTVIEGKTGLSPEELLFFVKTIEKEVGRVHRFRWGPREIDIDILFYADLLYQKENLQIPHPRLHERDFVLKPLSDLSSELLHPVLKKSISDILQELPEKKRSILTQK